MVWINGKETDIENVRLSTYLEENGYRLDIIVIEYNEEIISRQEYDSCILRDGDVLEIVSFMGGGCEHE
jgi:sulfur carrier protein